MMATMVAVTIESAEAANVWSAVFMKRSEFVTGRSQQKHEAGREKDDEGNEDRDREKHAALPLYSAAAFAGSKRASKSRMDFSTSSLTWRSLSWFMIFRPNMSLT
jgi:hypothetical protein